MLILMLILMSMLLGAGLCDLPDGAGTARPEVVDVQGVLVFGRHAAYLMESDQSTVANRECRVLVVYGEGIPRSWLRGFESEPITSNLKLEIFTIDYRNHLDKGEPLMVRVRGRMVSRKNFGLNGDHRGNGFGQRGGFRQAIFVDEISLGPPKKRPLVR